MYFKVFIFSLIFIVFNVNGNLLQNKSKFILFIKDFMEYYQHPNYLYVHNCWPKAEQIKLEKELQNVSLVSKLFSQSPAENHDSFLFVDMTCNKRNNNFKKLQNKELFSPKRHWIFFNYNSSLINTFYPINSDINFIEESSYGYLIKSIYKVSTEAKLEANPIGNWTEQEGYTEILSKPEAVKLRHLHKAPIKVSYLVEDVDTVEHLEDYQYKVLKDTMTKLNFALLIHLSGIVNGTKVDIFRRNTEGNNAMLYDLKIGNSDVAGTPYKLLSEEIDDFDVLDQTAITEKKFIFRATPHSYIGNVFTMPFDIYVWLSGFGLIAIIFLVVYLVIYWEWTDPVFNRYLTPRICLRLDAVDIFLMEIGSAAQQGYESEPRSNSGRIVFILTLISLMFLYTSFSASIVALLQSTTESLNTLENLFQSRVSVGFKENISMDYFNELKYHQSKTKEFVRKISKPEFVTTEQGIKRVQSDFFAFYGDTFEMYKYVNDWFYENEKCSLREIRFKNTHVNYWLFMRKNSTYQDILRTGMHKIHETGIQSREYRRLFATKPTCNVVGGNFESVGLSDSYGAFLVMVGGVLLSVALFFVEKIWQKFYFKIKRSVIRLRNSNF